MLILGYLLCWAPGIALAEKGEILLFDFDDRTLTESWTAKGPIRAHRQRLPPGPADAEADLRPAEKGIEIVTQGPSGLYSSTGHLPADWSEFESISLWLYRSADEAQRRPHSIVELQLLEQDRRTRFWRRMDLKHTGWKRVTIPLRWFRWSSGRIPQWDEIDHVGFWFRGATRVFVDTIWVESKESNVTAYFTPEDLARIGFPDDHSKVRIEKSEDITVITDAESLDLPKLVAHLQTVIVQIRKDMPFLDQPARPAILIVFSSRAGYAAFIERFAQQMNSHGSVPNLGSGYSFQGVSTSFWDKQFGTLRPVFTHELVHGYLTRCLPIANAGEWFHEGLATLYQIQFHPQDNLDRIVRRGLRDPRYRMELSLLCGGQKIPLGRYWQAMYVVKMLLHDPAYRDHLPTLTHAFASAGSTNLAPHLQSVLQKDWKTFARDWRAFCQRSLAADRAADVPPPDVPPRGSAGTPETNSTVAKSTHDRDSAGQPVPTRQTVRLPR